MNLLNKISQDVLRMSKSEPSGLNACLIHVELKELDGRVHHIGQIGFDTQTTPTMELRLRLHRHSNAHAADRADLAARIQKFVSRVISHKSSSGSSGDSGASSPSFAVLGASGDVIEISPGFQLVKEKSAAASTTTTNGNLLVPAPSHVSIASAPGSVQLPVDNDESSTDSTDSGVSNCSAASGVSGVSHFSSHDEDSNDGSDARMPRFPGDAPSTSSLRGSSRGRR